MTATGTGASAPGAISPFSNFADGRRYAAFLTDFFKPEKLTMDALGRLAQNALYYHERRQEPIPQDPPSYAHQANVPAGIRRTGPWTVALSGIIDTQAINSRYYLDRQGHFKHIPREARQNHHSRQLPTSARRSRRLGS
jgi:hypothetical protein